MSGESQQFSRRGITPRALHEVFEQADIAVDRQTTVKVSFVEVYNEVSIMHLTFSVQAFRALRLAFMYHVSA